MNLLHFKRRCCATRCVVPKILFAKSALRAWVIPPLSVKTCSPTGNWAARSIKYCYRLAASTRRTPWVPVQSYMVFIWALVHLAWLNVVLYLAGAAVLYKSLLGIETCIAVYKRAEGQEDFRYHDLHKGGDILPFCPLSPEGAPEFSRGKIEPPHLPEPQLTWGYSTAKLSLRVALLHVPFRLMPVWIMWAWGRIRLEPGCNF